MMKMKIAGKLLIVALLIGSTGSMPAQETGYTITIDKNIPVTSVKDQHRSGTCWSFAAISFLEAEILRESGETYDLSEMFLVRQCYRDKAEKYVRMHGKTNFGGGGLAHDLLDVWNRYGLVPQSAYPGLVIGEEGHVHGEMDGQLKAYVEAVIKNRNRKLTPVWMEGYEGILDAYLGDYPKSFSHEGESYTPASFADALPVDAEDYVTIGSFTHHDFYQPFILEIPDNWGWNSIYNVPLEEMMEVIDHSLESGYTVCWDADVSEKGFAWKEGLALLPDENIARLDGLERGRWDELSEGEKKALFYDFSSPKIEKKVTQEYRQQLFDNYITTDDHLMHITGLAKDQDGKRFYKVKNSWGVGNHIYDGYLFASGAYMRGKTIFVMVHKDAIPEDIAGKLGL